MLHGFGHELRSSITMQEKQRFIRTILVLCGKRGVDWTPLDSQVKTFDRLFWIYVTGSIRTCTNVGVLNFNVYHALVRCLLGFEQQ